MSWINKYVNSTIGRKVLTALTGLFLILFLIIHLLGNLQLMKDDGGYAFNTYAKKMFENPIIKIASYITYVAILFHAFMGLFLTFKNKQARGSSYAKSRPGKSSPWTSRYMGILGTIVLVFIVVHMNDFWAEHKIRHNSQNINYFVYTGDEQSFTYKIDSMEQLQSEEVLNEEQMMALRTGKAKADIVKLKDLYALVDARFKSPLIVLLYVLSMLAISFHLWHGFRSAFQTLGLNHSKYNALLKTIGHSYAIIIPALFALIPIYFYFFK